jgi:translation initiation factor 2B subunit (eIF-2B alpha/beta/delta family)
MVKIACAAIFLLSALFVRGGLVLLGRHFIYQNVTLLNMHGTNVYFCESACRTSFVRVSQTVGASGVVLAFNDDLTIIELL